MTTRICLRCQKKFKPYWSNQQYCSAKCGYNVPLEVRFWKRVKKGKDCWLWTGPPGTMGYGIVYVKGHWHNPSRIAWELHHGQSLSRSEHVLHKCDNPLCVRPSHLFLGTAKDNIQDAIKKSRFKFPPIKYGANHQNAVLTNKQAQKIRKMYNTTTYSYQELAELFNISKWTIGRVIRGISY